jgi:hypothetical protein
VSDEEYEELINSGGDDGDINTTIGDDLDDAGQYFIRVRNLSRRAMAL